jgi:hypothetical protein
MKFSSSHSLPFFVVIYLALSGSKIDNTLASTTSAVTTNNNNYYRHVGGGGGVIVPAISSPLQSLLLTIQEAKACSRCCKTPQLERNWGGGEKERET